MEELVNGVTAELSTASDGESDCEGEPLVDKDKEPEVDETAVKLEVCTNIVVPLDVEGVVATVMVDLPSPVRPSRRVIRGELRLLAQTRAE
ncbi:hypothetical protein JG687_00014159 [Phytophthora cactorum]|uniref:Uncharacterized protein n=1 Tax=Phytophthora cactorum TaxID=29920 RepID=A0A329RWL1_9STRA|nr:hypothetical protein Pcac1_g13741 [Phytophthora cactorum]KAG2805008.1 hypothetical protein PC112_g18460 [Phytophthora cactorum]KAG2810522.1 hypothetical protein PC111_g15622 [Phytophthora cactorum]KAG2854951.1 hypothetical protein PC113_g12857 [Phytophthora cactorum]KAG2895319.1 hypothetical protein PC115_g17875 [Phytophthora cactorum]